MQLFDIFPYSDPLSLWKVWPSLAHIVLPKWAKLAIRLTSKQRGERKLLKIDSSSLWPLRLLVTHGKDPTQPPTVWEKIMIWHRHSASGKPPQISSKINSIVTVFFPLWTYFFSLNVQFCSTQYSMVCKCIYDWVGEVWIHSRLLAICVLRQDELWQKPATQMCQKSSASSSPRNVLVVWHIVYYCFSSLAFPSTSLTAKDSK